MSNGDSALPPPRILQATLRKITERLAGELSSPTGSPPDWNAFEWQIARAVTAMHGVSQLLAVRLRWEGPVGWRPWLEAQRQHVAKRHRRIEALLEALHDGARGEEIALVALKGAALHSLGVYGTGDRPMADVDLLVSPRDADRAVRLIESLGFRQSFANWKHRVFVPQSAQVAAAMGEHADNPLKIELHERIGEMLPLCRTEITELVFPARARPGLNPYPSKAALMSHLLLHAAGAMASRSLRLLHLHDLALLASRMTDEDWDELVAGGSGHRTVRNWWALPPLKLVSRYYHDAVPVTALSSLAANCKWLLTRSARKQTLSDVSFSYLWIDAFPGIGWSQSLTEMLRYMATRIRPEKEMLEMRQTLRETQVALHNSEWAGMTQSRRIIRWATGGQPRADTLHALRTALAQS
jgi:Uncharacterised nucleotidyltransferase